MMMRGHKRFLTVTCAGVALMAASALSPAYAGLFDKKDPAPAAKTAMPAPPNSAPIMQARPISFADLAADLLPTVVNISSTVKTEAGPDMEEIMPHFPKDPPLATSLNALWNAKAKVCNLCRYLLWDRVL